MSPWDVNNVRACWRGLAAVAGLALALGYSDAAGRAVADMGVQFERDVLPLLKKRCAACHGPLKAEAGLTLVSARYVARGSDEGPVVVAGDPGRSRLWRVVESDEMPEDEPLSASEKGVLREWIASGAPGLPSAAGRGEAPIEHWAFAHLDRATMSRSVPAEAQGVRTTIDRFVAARLAEKGLQLSPEADRATLIRRVALDLTGLPPTMEELQAFLLDSRPQAYSAMVDRYLASVHYGERWGKYWLDVAGYADSDGYFIDFDQDRPLAFLYRDYVIRSFNSNKPFDQFVREQLAGDELAGNRPGQDLTPEQIDMLVATHFLRNSEDGSDRNMGTPRERITTRYATLEGTMRIVASS
ncbi:MAG TPA: DUF1549 domain-containing protein, partial [Planctomycetaceae bacterium]|nr:DUF1549 domain-containing protein [Planctomycetaceae bacterium]